MVSRGSRVIEFLTPSLAEVAQAEARFDTVLRKHPQLRKRLSNITEHAKHGGGLLSGVPPQPQWTKPHMRGEYCTSDTELSDECNAHLTKIAESRAHRRRKSKPKAKDSRKAA
jgi:hypothetical protein